MYDIESAVVNNPNEVSQSIDLPSASDLAGNFHIGLIDIGWDVSVSMDQVLKYTYIDLPPYNRSIS